MEFVPATISALMFIAYGAVCYKIGFERGGEYVQNKWEAEVKLGYVTMDDKFYKVTETKL